LSQDDYYYEIQLTNKQLVFYFMAGATGLILSFLAGVMVGRGVEAPVAEAQGPRSVREEKIVAEEVAKAAAPAPTPDQLTYAKRLESDKPDDALDSGKPAAEAKPPASREPGKDAAKPPAKKPAGDKDAGRPKPAHGDKTAADKPDKPAVDKPAADKPPAEKPPQVASDETHPPATAAPHTAAPKPAPETRPAAAETKPVAAAGAPHLASGTFTIQVGAFRDRGSAESVAGRLKGKGFAAYVAQPDADGGLFNVRVGSYVAKADAERVKVKLKDEEKFNPFIVPIKN
jgi:cell division protein FtsN